MPAGVSGPALISAARNEFESFQIVLRPVAQNLEEVDVEVADFAAPGGKILGKENVTVYLPRFLDLKTASSVEGASGKWPDPLVPRVDRYTGERRNAFPFRVSNGRNQPIWIEVYVPPGTAPATYGGTVTVIIAGRRDVVVPVHLEVWDFEIPSTSSLRNSFGLNGINLLEQHLGGYTNDKDLRALTHIYRKAALWHRLSVHGGSMTPPRYHFADGGIVVDWKWIDAEVGPFLDGTAFREDEPLFGARATSVDMHRAEGIESDEEKILYWKAYAAHFREKGWFDRLFNYLWDEPKAADYEELLRIGRLVHQADPELKNLLTAPLASSTAGTVDIWAPLVNCFVTREGHRNFCKETVDRARYSKELERGRELWWYQSCASHGCFIIGSAYFRGWPSYMIDHSGVANRIMQWMAWKYDVDGELYFNLNEAYGSKEDPWRDVHLFGGNGDGTLVYPGRPDVIGGSTHIPIESIRLKLIREGLEDYEYLTLLSKHASPSETAIFVDSLVTNLYTYETDPAKLYEIRHKIGRILGHNASKHQR